MSSSILSATNRARLQAFTERVGKLVEQHEPALQEKHVGLLIAAMAQAILDLDDQVVSIDEKDSVRAVSVGALPAYTRVGNIITANANGALPAQDGVTLVVDDRFGLLDGASHVDDGIYEVVAVGGASAKWSMQRAADADTSEKVTSGLFFRAEEGSTKKGVGFLLTTANPITLNSTTLTFEEDTGITSRSNADIQDVGTAASAGTSRKLAAADHVHNHGSQTSGTLHAAVQTTVGGGASGFMIAADKDKLDGVEALADVTDATNVAAAGAVMDGDFPALPGPAYEADLVRTGLNTYTARKTVYASAIDPAPATHDDAAGFMAGSVLVNTTAVPPRVWDCLSPATGAAVWRQRKVKCWSAAVPPTADNDASGGAGPTETGFDHGSVWVDTALDFIHVCADPTNTAAVWKRLLVSGDTAGGDLTGTYPSPTVADKVLDGGNANEYADGGTTPGLPVYFAIPTVAAAGDNDLTLPAGMKIKVVDCWFQKTVQASGGAFTVQLKSTAAVITDAMAGAIADKAVLRPIEIDDANATIAAGGILRATTTDAGGNKCDGVMHVLAIRVA